MGIFFLLSAVQTLSGAGVSFVGAAGAVKASRSLHETMLSRVVYSPMAFFDATPLGRIVNRFTKVGLVVEHVIIHRRGGASIAGAHLSSTVCQHDFVPVVVSVAMQDLNQMDTTLMFNVQGGSVFLPPSVIGCI
jgi:ABC-type multidrug transport system fused ATPase/permease subunit